MRCKEATRLRIYAQVTLTVWFIGVVFGDGAAETNQTLPAQAPSAFRKEMATLLRLTDEELRQHFAGLESSDVQTRTQAELVVSGLVKYVTGQKGASERSRLAFLLTGALDASGVPDQQAFLLEQLAMLGVPSTVPTISAYIKNPRLCDPACRALVSIGGKKAQVALLEALRVTSEDELLPSIISALGDLRVQRAAPIIEKHGQSSSRSVRDSAIRALAKIANTSSKRIFLASLQETNETPERNNLASYALSYAHNLCERRARRDAETIFLFVLDAPESRFSSPVRCAALTGLASCAGNRAFPRLMKGLASEDAAFRSVVLRCSQSFKGQRYTNLLLAKAKEVDPVRRAEVVEMLGCRRDRSALQGVRTFLGDPHPEVRMAATRALVSLAPDEAAQWLAELLKSEQDPQVLQEVKASLLRLSKGVETALTLNYAAFTPAGKATALEVIGSRQYRSGLDVVRAALSDETKAVRLAAVGAWAQIGTPEDLPALLRLLTQLSDDDETSAVKKAIVALSCQYPDHAGRLTALQEAWRSAQGQVRDHLKEVINAICAVEDSEGFVCLFNGIDLSGWVGDTEGYVAENGLLVCKPGGNLYTEKEYADFIFHFEFKLTPGANNGLAVRAPLGGGAYNGMEIQILDDYADIYKDLHPWQYHGSIYGIVPVKRGHLKPAGEWNTEQVIAKGRRITVVLNGVTVVDADLDEATKPQPMDGKLHEGLDREKGHLGFLGHGSVLEFRNIKIKEL